MVGTPPAWMAHRRTGKATPSNWTNTTPSTSGSATGCGDHPATEQRSRERVIGAGACQPGRSGADCGDNPRRPERGPESGGDPRRDPDRGVDQQRLPDQTGKNDREPANAGNHPNEALAGTPAQADRQPPSPPRRPRAPRSSCQATRRQRWPTQPTTPATPRPAERCHQGVGRSEAELALVRTPQPHVLPNLASRRDSEARSPHPRHCPTGQTQI